MEKIEVQERMYINRTEELFLYQKKNMLHIHEVKYW